MKQRHCATRNYRNVRSVVPRFIFGLIEVKSITFSGLDGSGNVFEVFRLSFANDYIFYPFFYLSLQSSSTRLSLIMNSIATFESFAIF